MLAFAAQRFKVAPPGPRFAARVFEAGKCPLPRSLVRLWISIFYFTGFTAPVARLLAINLLLTSSVFLAISCVYEILKTKH